MVFCIPVWVETRVSEWVTDKKRRDLTGYVSDIEKKKKRLIRNTVVGVIVHHSLCVIQGSVDGCSRSSIRCKMLVIELICCSTKVKRSLKPCKYSRTVGCPIRGWLGRRFVRYRGAKLLCCVRDEIIVSRDEGIKPSVKSSLRWRSK